jgi:hypothetical protein
MKHGVRHFDWRDIAGSFNSGMHERPTVIGLA